ncbi:SCO family protein [Deinococcus sp. PESE-13]
MKWLTAALLTVAAVLAGLLVYRSAAPGRGGELRGGTALDTPLAVPPLPLTDDRGRPTTLAASDGRLRLVFFGYARCPDVCPVTLAGLERSYKTLSDEQRRRVQVQLVTVDPVNDTPKVLRDYLDRFDPAFSGLTGSPDTINAAAKALFVSNVNVAPAADHSEHMQMSGQGNAPAVSAPDAARIHGDELRVIDPQGQFVRVYTNGEVMDGTLDHDLPALIRQYAGG